MASSYVIPPPEIVSLPVIGQAARFPVRRIYCVGKNYAAHVREMGGDAAKSTPVFFTKSRETIVPSASKIPYPPMTSNLHYELELVVAMASQCEVFGYGVGLDMTRRDLQAEAKQGGKPWDMAKNFDSSAPCAALVPTKDAPNLDQASITLKKNNSVCQSSSLDKMIWSVSDILSHLNKTVTLAAGDLIFTGTPQGVGPVVAGDHLVGEITGLPILDISYV